MRLTSVSRQGHSHGLVSILLPAHNAGRWLGETLDSVVAQSWPRTEVIVVDDGSTDNTLTVAAGYSDRGVRVIAQPNRGAAAARNAALNVARGSYIQFLDADDLLHPEKLARQMRSVGGGFESQTLLTSAWGRFFERPDRASFAPDPLWQDLSPVDWLVTKFTHNRFMFPASWLVSRRLADAAGPWNESLSLDDDGEYMSRLVAASRHVRFVAQARSYYRIGNVNSLSSQKSDRAVRSGFRSMCLSIDHLLALEDSERTRRACVRLLQDNLHQYYPEYTDLVADTLTLANHLGDDLMSPAEPRRFRVFRQVFGWKRARQVRGSLNLWKLRIKRTIESLPQSGARSD